MVAADTVTTRNVTVGLEVTLECSAHDADDASVSSWLFIRVYNSPTHR